jgi:hypothetical protein
MRSYANHFSEFFKTYTKGANTNDEIGRRSPREVGTFSMTYSSIPTLFMDDSLQLNQLFDKFETNRQIISESKRYWHTR